MQIDAKHWHKIYESMPKDSQESINRAWQAAQNSLRIDDMEMDNGDSSECVIAAMTAAIVSKFSRQIRPL